MDRVGNIIFVSMCKSFFIEICIWVVVKKRYDSEFFKKEFRMPARGAKSFLIQGNKARINKV